MFACGLGARGETAARYAPGELLVKFRPGSDRITREELKSAVRAHTLHVFDTGLEQIRLPDGVRVEDAAATLGASPQVEFAEPNYEIHVLGVPIDPRFPESWALHNTGQNGGTPGADIHAVEAWDIFTGDPDLMIGVIDSGIDYNHPDLVDNIWTNQAEANGIAGVDDDGDGLIDDIHGYNFYDTRSDPMDDYAHGTAVAGIIAARGDNALGTAGVAWRAKLVAIKFIGWNGVGWLVNAIQAIDYSAKIGCRVSNLSWSLGPVYSQALLDAINAAGATGELFVAAAGNDAKDIDRFPEYPTSFHSPYIISVAACDSRDALADFSNYGLNIDVAAPGVDILTTLAEASGGGYVTASGTSFAAPHVAGVCALILGRHPGFTAPQVKDLIRATVEQRAALAGKISTGGRIDARLTPSNDLCSEAVQLPNGTSVIVGSTYFAKDDRNPFHGDGSASSCLSQDASGVDVFYKLSALSGDTLTVLMTDTTTYHPLFYVLNTCDSVSATCLPVQGVAPEFHLVFPSSGTYYLVVDGISGDCGDFEFTCTVRGAVTGLVGNEQPARMQLTAAPNPNHGIVLLSGWVPARASSEGVLSIMDLSGRLLLKKDVVVAGGRFATIWDLRHPTGTRLPNGIYYARLELAGQSAKTHIVVLE
jgi:subtilisin family serine protease